MTPRNPSPPSSRMRRCSAASRLQGRSSGMPCSRANFSTRGHARRRHDPARAWRRRGWVVEERRLLGVTRRLVIDSAPTLANLLPAELPAEFTTAELAQVLGRPRRLAQQMAYCLRRVRAIEVIGKDGNALVYARPAGPGLGRGNG